jgi:hypothetical protein
MYAPFQNIFPCLPERLLSAIWRQQSRSRMRLGVNDNQRCFADLTRAGSLLILDNGYKTGNSHFTVPVWRLHDSFLGTNKQFLYFIAQNLNTRSSGGGTSRGRPGGRNGCCVDIMLVPLQVPPIIFALRVLLIHLERPLRS